MTTISEVAANVGAAGMIAGCIALRPLVQPSYSRWHATAAEVSRPLPGDERVPNPSVEQTLAVTIAAPPPAVWPWVAQIGQERGGLYSYELLENLAQCHMHNATRVVPEWELVQGDRVRFGPPGYPVMRVVGIERGCWLLLAGADLKTAEVAPLPQPGDPTYINQSWVFYLEPAPNNATRLITRSRLDYAPRSFGSKVMWEWMTDPIGFVMTRKMLLTIKAQAEANSKNF